MSTLGFREAIPTILLLVTVIAAITLLRFTIITICNISMFFASQGGDWRRGESQCCPHGEDSRAPTT